MVVMPPQVSLGWAGRISCPACRPARKGEIMSKAVIPSYTLLDFLSEGDMLAFFTFVEEHMEGHAANLRVHGMTKFYVSRVFNKGDK